MKKLGLLTLGLIAASAHAIDYQYVDDPVTGYNSLGVPTNMTNINSSLPTDILNNIYGMLPESQTVNPAYVSADVYSNIHFDNDAATFAEATVTFLNEGAGYRNSLGYFVYDTNNPPASIEEIPAHTIIFPNASKPSDGNMQQGDTVDLGIQIFSGQSLGFFVVPNGWSYSGSGSTIAWDGPWNQPFYSLQALNPEPAAYKRHNVVFVDPVNELLVIGFDDQFITQGDKDYNDILFSVEITPFFNVDGINPDGSIDSGYIPLEQDDGGSNTTTTSYYPSQSGYATLMYEDLWPEIGDYDFNDLVVKHQITRTLTSQSELQRLQGTYIVQAKGASFHNGFALRLPGVAQGDVDTISVKKNGVEVSHEIIETAASELVMIISPDISVDVSSGCEMFRTVPSCRESINTTFELDVTFSNPPAANTIGLPPYDPFIFSIDGTYHGDVFSAPPGREWELHLKQFSGTNLFNNAFFNMADDASNSANKYITVNNMPWALVITDEWDHPAEYEDISHAYPEFPLWVQSGGITNTNWYLRSKADTSKLYE
jgi:LruC domain-containing protein